MIGDDDHFLFKCAKLHNVNVGMRWLSGREPMSVMLILWSEVYDFIHCGHFLVVLYCCIVIVSCL
jgi:hypothetical protein